MPVIVLIGLPAAALQGEPPAPGAHDGGGVGVGVGVGNGVGVAGGVPGAQLMFGAHGGCQIGVSAKPPLLTKSSASKATPMKLRGADGRLADAVPAGAGKARRWKWRERFM
ncbi:MAG TPA: hypothetical protein DDZ22_19225 [Massilia sp.]|nr:hypothetical protein [Massilia sp.]